ncbi:gamma-aminobutyric acid receptor subunit gamma-1-like isoform X2 [Oculina patagonica]
MTNRLVLVFVLLQISFLFVASEKPKENSAKDVEELFAGRIEAPNKTIILDNIFKGYDNRVRPFYREKPVPIALYAVIDSFHDIREDQMEYKVELILKENWKDPRLAYGNQSWFVRLKHDMLKKMWYPDTLIENSRKHDVDDKTRTAYLFGDGTIFFSEWIKATLTSHMDFKSYPMDVQTLRLQIAAYSYDDSQVQYKWIKVSLREHDMTEFYVEKETHRLESTAYITGTHTAAVAEFQIRRRLQHFILGFYLPCISCTIASWLQFWMCQTAVGDRAGLGITTVLTEIFLLEFSGQGMPKVSYMKAAELYVIVSFGFIFLALVESAIVYKASGWSVLKKEKQELVNHQQVDKNQTSETPGKDFNKGIHSLVMSSIYDQTENKSSEYIFREVERSEDTDPPEKPTPTACTDTNQNWGVIIDRGARLLFPITYSAFTVVYFVLIL